MKKNLFEREPAVIIAALAMVAYTVYRVAVNDLALESVLSEDYLAYVMGGVAALATRLKAFSPATVASLTEARLTDTQDRGDAPDVPVRRRR